MEQWMEHYQFLKQFQISTNPDMKFQKKMLILMLRHPLSVKERWAPSAQRNTRVNHLGKAHPGSVVRENVPFDLSFNWTVSSPSISSNRFCFSANMEENSSWLKNLLTGNSLISQKDLLRWLQKVLSFIPLAPLKYYLKQPLTTLWLMTSLLPTFLMN